jgi:hypothetical protein
MKKRGADLVRFYRLMDELQTLNGSLHRLATARPGASWPRRGVVWFYEKGESRSDSGAGPRIVRVGTHALKPELNSTLWDKLAQDGTGSHRQSLFRTLVGLSLRDLTGKTEPQGWGRDRPAGPATPADAPDKYETALESAVSLYVGQMPFVVLAVDDAPGPRSERAFIERNSIALLSNYARQPLDAPSAAWLGRRCGREKVRQSGLWNTAHVDAAYDPSFMDTMKSLMEDMRQAISV